MADRFPRHPDPWSVAVELTANVPNAGPGNGRRTAMRPLARRKALTICSIDAKDVAFVRRVGPRTHFLSFSDSIVIKCIHSG